MNSFFAKLTSFSWPDVVGNIGVVILLANYFLLQLDKLKAHQPAYLIINAFGSIFILVSLYYNWNLSSALMQVIWIMISIFGLVKTLKQKS